VARSLPAAAGADALLAQHDPSAEAAPVVVEPEDAWVRKLDAELAEFNAMDKAWQSTSVAADILQELTLQRSLADSTRD
jgi:hypothetical protein